jgi:hypothetical protein
MCQLLALALSRIFLQRPLTVLTILTRQAVCAIKQSIFNMMSMAFSCLYKARGVGDLKFLFAHCDVTTV